MGTNERTGLIVLARRTRWVSLALFLGRRLVDLFTNKGLWAEGMG